VVSVIVPAYNAEATLGDCLAALQLIRQPNAGPAAARNRGVQAARGEILLFTDADCAPTPDWIERLTEPFRAPEVAGAKGVYRTRQRELVARFVQLEYEDKYARMSRQDRIDFVDTYSAAYRRDVFLANGGFDALFPAASVEDQEFSFRLARKGCPSPVLAPGTGGAGFPHASGSQGADWPGGPPGPLAPAGPVLGTSALVCPVCRSALRSRGRPLSDPGGPPGPGRGGGGSSAPGVAGAGAGHGAGRRLSSLLPPGQPPPTAHQRVESAGQAGDGHRRQPGRPDPWIRPDRFSSPKSARGRTAAASGWSNCGR
jgi:hypothetical protein